MKGPTGPYKVDLGKRLGAGAIDAAIAAILGIAVAFAAGPFGVVFPLAYLLLRDGLPIAPLDNQSIGKKILGLHVETTATGEPRADVVASIKRNAPLAAGLVLFPLLWSLADQPIVAVVLTLIPAIVETGMAVKDPNGLRLGDRLAGTKVLD